MSKVPNNELRGVLLDYLPIDQIISAYSEAPGNELESGKFFSPESSSALVANAFGYFLGKPDRLPPLPGLQSLKWPASELALEVVVRFPWAGGKHPCLDVLVRSADALIGIESKRFEPFRGKSPKKESDAYLRDVWGEHMCGYRKLWEAVAKPRDRFEYLDAKQLIKHAFAIRTQIHRARDANRTGALYYLYAEPSRWADGRLIDDAALESHSKEIQEFADAVGGDEVIFVACSYRDLLGSWRVAGDGQLAKHVAAVTKWADLPLS